jgi:hypothetical protein
MSRKILVEVLILVTEIENEFMHHVVKQNWRKTQRPLYLTKFVQGFLFRSNLSWIFPAPYSAGSREELRFCRIEMEHTIFAFGVEKPHLKSCISYLNKNKRAWHIKAQYLSLCLLIWFISETCVFDYQLCLILVMIGTFTGNIQPDADKNQFLPCVYTYLLTFVVQLQVVQRVHLEVQN